MGGKGSTDEINGGPMSGKLNPGKEVAAKKRKDSGLYSEDDVGGHYGGKGSTDEIGDDPISGKLKPGEAKEKEDKKKNSFKEDAIAGHMGGKGSTDELDGSPLSGALKPGEAKEKEDKKKNSFKEDAIAGHMGGKSSTDDLDRAPLVGSLKPGEQGSSGSNHTEYEEDAITGHLGGKTIPADIKQPYDASSDELNRDGLSPFGKKKNNALADDPAPLGAENQSEVENPLGQNPDQPFNPPHQLTQEEFDKLPRAEKDALSRDGIGIISKDKDGNPILDENGKPALTNPFGQKKKTEFNTPHKLTQEEFDKLPRAEKDALSRDGIGIISKDKDGNPILDEDGKPVLKDLRVGNIKDSIVAGSSSNTNQQTDKSVADIKSPFGKKPLPMINGNNELEKEQAEKEANATESEAGQSSSSANKNPLSKSANLTNELEASMEEALGGGIAETLNTKSDENKKADLNKQIGGLRKEESDVIDLQTEIGKAAEKKEFDLSKIIDGKAQVRTESGEIKVILKQETKAGNDITFICDFEDFYTDELVVHAPKNSLPLNSKVKGKVSLKYGDQKINVVIEGTISEVEEFDERKDTLVIDVNSISEKDYDQFMSLYQDRQESIIDFIQKAKGY